MTSTPRSRISLALVTAVVAVVTAGCGNSISAEVVGAAAITAGRDGSPVLLVATCGSNVDTIEIVGGRGGLEPDEPNPTVASWTAPTLQSGTIVLDVADPPPPWTSDDTVALVDEDLYIVSAGRSDKDAEVTQVSFHGRDLVALDPGDVIVGEGTVESRTGFEAGACDDD